MFGFLSGPPGSTCLISFALVLLSPYLCCISSLYLELYALGDTLIR